MSSFDGKIVIGFDYDSELQRLTKDLNDLANKDHKVKITFDTAQLQTQLDKLVVKTPDISLHVDQSQVNNLVSGLKEVQTGAQQVKDALEGISTPAVSIDDILSGDEDITEQYNEYIQLAKKLRERITELNSAIQKNIQTNGAYGNEVTRLSDLFRELWNAVDPETNKSVGYRFTELHAILSQTSTLSQEAKVDVEKLWAEANAGDQTQFSGTSSSIISMTKALNDLNTQIASFRSKRDEISATLQVFQNANPGDNAAYSDYINKLTDAFSELDQAVNVLSDGRIIPDAEYQRIKELETFLTTGLSQLQSGDLGIGFEGVSKKVTSASEALQKCKSAIQDLQSAQTALNEAQTKNINSGGKYAQTVVEQEAAVTSAEAAYEQAISVVQQFNGNGVTDEQILALLDWHDQIEAGSKKSVQALNNARNNFKAELDKHSEMLAEYSKQINSFLNGSEYNDNSSTAFRDNTDTASLQLMELEDILKRVNQTGVFTETDKSRVKEIEKSVGTICTNLSSGALNKTVNGATVIGTSDIANAEAYVRGLTNVDEATVKVNQRQQTITATIKEAGQQYQQVTVFFDKLAQSYRAVTTSETMESFWTRQVKEAQSAISEYQKANAQLEQMRITLAKSGVVATSDSDFKNQATLVQSLKTKAEGAVSSISSLNTQLGNTQIGTNAVTAVTNAWVTAQTAVTTQQQKTQSTLTQMKQKIDACRDAVTEYVNALGQSSNGTSAATGFYADDAASLSWTTYSQKLQEFSTSVEKLKRLLPDDGIDVISEASLTRINEITPQLQKLYKELSSGAYNMSSQNGALTQFTNANSVISYLKSLESVDNATIKINKHTGQITASMKANNNQVQQLQYTFDKASNTYRVLTSDVTASESVFKRIANSVSQSAQYFTHFMSGYMLTTQIISAVREGVEAVTELDTALTEMRKVSDDSETSLRNLQSTFFDLADSIGTTAADITEATASFMRIGESAEEAVESATQAAILYNVSEFESIDEAADALVAISQAYDEVGKSQIVDIINELGNNYAIATDELAEGLQTVSSTLSLLGVSLEQTSAMVTTANETIQDASKVATGLRTVALRIFATEESEEELEELGEEVDDFVTATTGTREQIIKDYTAVASNGYKGISIVDEETGVYRNLYDILLDIAEIYEEIQAEDLEFGTNRATALIEVLGGKNRSSIVSALLSSPDTLADALESAENSAGSATEELSKYLDSIEGKMETLTNKVQEFWSTAIDSSLIKAFLDLANAAMEGVNAFTELQGVIPAVAAAITAVKSTKNDGIYSPLADALTNFAKNNSVVKKLTSGFLDLGDATDQVTDSVDEQAEAFTKLGEADDAAADATGNLTTKTNLLNVALNALTAYAIALIAQSIIEFIYSWTTAEERLADAVLDATNAVADAEETIEDYKDQISEQQAILADETTTQEEAAEAREELLAIQSELIETYGDESDVIGTVTEAVWENVDALDALAEAEYKAQKEAIENNEDGSWVDKAADAVSNALNGYDNNFDRVISTMGNGVGELGYQVVFSVDVDNTELDEALQQVEGLTRTDYGYAIQYELADGTLQSQIEAIEEIEQISNKLGTGDIFGTASDALVAAQEVYDTYADFYQLWLEYDSDSPLKGYADEAAELQEIYNDFNKAIVNDDSDARAEAIEQFVTFFDELPDDTPQSVLDYFENIYSTIVAEISSWEFDEALANSTNNWGDRIEEYFGFHGVVSESGMTSILESGGSFTLNQVLEESGLSVDELVEKLKDLGYVVDDSVYSIVDAFEGIDVLEELGNDISYALQLTQAELDECAGDFDKLTDKINDMKQAAVEAAKSTSTITDAVSTLTDNVEPQFEALAEAYTTIWDEDTGFSLDIDNSVLEGVRSAFDDLDDSITEAFDTEVLDDFLVVLADTSSTSEDVQNAFNSLATEYLEASGLIDTLNEDTVDYVATQLENIGVTNGEEVAMSLLAQQEAEAIDAAYDLSNVTADEIEQFGILTGVSEATAQQLVLLKIQQILCTENWVDETDSINSVLALANAAGITIEYLSDLQKAQQFIANATSYSEIARGNYMLADAQANLEAEIAELSTKAYYNGSTSSGGSSSSSGSSSSDASDTADEYVDAYEEAKAQLQKLRDRDTISEKEYLRRLRVLYSQYYADVEEYSEEFFDEQREYLEDYKAYYDEVLEYIIDIYDDQIDDLEDECDEIVDQLEAQKDAAHDAYQAQIDDIEDLIDALEDQIDEYDKQIKAYEKQQKALEKQIDALQDQIDAYDDQIEELEDQIDAYDDQIEAIEEIQEQYEDEIELLEEKQEALEDVIEEYEDQIEAYEDMIDAYQDQIDAIQDEIDALEDANDERERELALQEALYALEQAKNQKTNLVYSAESGYTYQADEDAIKEAEDALYEAQLDITVAALEKEIDALEDLQDAIQDEIDLIEDQIEAIEDQIEALDDEIEYFQDMIDALDDEIEAIEKLQEDIEDQIEAIEELQDELQDQIDLIQDQIDAIDEQIEIIEEYQEAIQEQIDMYEEQVDDLNEMMDASDEYFDSLIETTEAFYDQQIAELEAWRDEFQQLLDMYDEAIAKQQLMDMGLTEEDILGMSIEEFAGIAAQYTGILADMSAGNTGLQQQLSDMANVQISELNGHLTDTNDEFEQLSGIDLTNAVNSSQSLRDGLLDAKTAAILMAAAVGGDSSLLVDTESEAANLGSSTITAALAAAAAQSSETAGQISEELGQITTDSGETAEAMNGTIDELSAYILELLAADYGEINGNFEQINQDAITTSSQIITGPVADAQTGVETALAAMETASQTENAEMQADFQATSESVSKATSYVDDLINALNDIPRTIDVTVSITTNGDTSYLNYEGTVGNAYASGYPGLKHSEHNALRSEFGQPELTVYPDGTYELTTSPVISDLPKDTVIFNDEQTERILNGEGTRGHSFAGGTFFEVDPSSILMTALAAQSAISAMTNDFRLESMIDKLGASIAESISVETPAQTVNQTFNISLPNVTDSTSATTLMRDLQLIASKKTQYFG